MPSFANPFAGNVERKMTNAPTVGPSSACRTARQAVRRNAAQKRVAHARIT